MTYEKMLADLHDLANKTQPKTVKKVNKKR